MHLKLTDMQAKIWLHCKVVDMLNGLDSRRISKLPAKHSKSFMTSRKMLKDSIKDNTEEQFFGNPS